jgi:hypothetical protein
MTFKKHVGDHLKGDGIHLNDEELQSVIQFLNSLAKIEYEVYRQEKLRGFHCRFQNGRDIGSQND